MFCCLPSQHYEIPLKVTQSPFSDSLHSHFLLCLTLNWLHSSASISLHSCISFLFPSSHLSALLITIKVPYEIQSSITLLDSLLHNRFIFSFSDTDEFFLKKGKQEIIEHLCSVYSLHMMLYMKKLSFISKDFSFSGFSIFTYMQNLTCQIFIKEVMRQFYL